MNPSQKLINSDQPVVATATEPASGEAARPADSDPARILAAAVDILLQGELLLTSLPPSAYVERLPVAFNASIGGHYGHCLDHFTSLLGGLDGAAIDYDLRERDSRLKSQPDFALALTRRIRAGIECLEPSALRTPVVARCEVSYGHGESPLANSSIGRELVYVIAHAIHHYALISVMARIMDVDLPSAFGAAPYTVSHLRSTAGHWPFL